MDQINSLVPGPQGAPPLTDSLSQSLSEAQVKHSGLAETARKSEVIRTGLDALVAKGDMITIDDVVDEAATLIAEGADAKILATVLATMPTSGNSGELQAWVAQRDAEWTHAEHMLQVHLRIAGHDLGVRAIRALAGHALEGEASNA